MKDLTRKQDSIRALGRIEGFKNDVRLLRAAIDQTPLWRPGVALKKQCDEVLRVIAGLEERFERKLVVTLIGPCGSGKSTLMNALAGVDGLSPTGRSRPTTRSVVLLCREKADAGQFGEALGPENLQMRASPAASLLENVLLIDTPDTDSTEQAKHIPIVQKAIALSDVLVCVFDAENPKRRDHVDFLAPYVRLFNGESLIGVINKCDRQDENELKEKILPEFLAFIREAWDRPLHTMVCTSARSRLHEPAWDPGATPRHAFDEFDKLHEMIFGTFNRPGYVIDRRLKNAASLRDYVYREVRLEAEGDRKRLEDGARSVRQAERSAFDGAFAAFEGDDSGELTGVNVLLYQKLAHRWLGPVGWLVALWARILIFATGIAAAFRFGSPFRHLRGVVASLKNFKEPAAAPAEHLPAGVMDSALRGYRLSVMQDWPDIAETLVQGRFDPSIRKIDGLLPEQEPLRRDLAEIWRNALESAVDEASRGLSGALLQLIFNLPVIAILGHAGWITIRNYLSGTYLPSDFFLHALLTVGIVLFLAFFLLQACIRMAAGSERIARKAFERAGKQIEQLEALSLNPVGRQIDAVLNLAASHPSDR